MLSTGIKLYLIIALFLLSTACVNQARSSQTVPGDQPGVQSKASPKPKIPLILSEILNDENSRTDDPVGKFDFRNFTYPLPRGWQDIDSKEITLVDGVRRMTEEKIGMQYLTTKFFDVTGDNVDEALVILKVGTGGSAIPQIVYVFEQKQKEQSEPDLIWYFRTGDRADGGLKRIYPADGELVVELFGRDRYIFNHMETSKIVGDEQQLCCPTHWTRTRYKWEGKNFVLQGDRWTYSFKDNQAEPVKNMNEVKLQEERGTRK